MNDDRTTPLSRLGMSLAGVALIAALALSAGCGKKDKPADTAGDTEAAATAPTEPAVAEDSEKVAKARKTDSHNANQLGLALLMYAGDYSGHFPPEFAVLADVDIMPPGKVWVSPGFEPATTAPATPADIRAGKTDYVYLGSGLKDDNGDFSKVVILHTREGAFGGEMMSALFIDGHVEAVEGKDIKAAAEKNGWQLGK